MMRCLLTFQGFLWILSAVAVLFVILGTTVYFLNRWAHEAMNRPPTRS